MKTMSNHHREHPVRRPPVADFDADLYQLHQLSDRIVVALGDSHPRPALRHAITEDLLAQAFVPPVRPVLEFTLPMPDWAAL